MKANNSTALALPSTEKLNKAVEPKPTKREIIEAMVQIEHPRRVADWEAKRKWKDDEEKVLKNLVVKATRKQIYKLNNTYTDLGSVRTLSDGKLEHYGADVRFDNIPLPEDLQARIIAWDQTKVRYQAQTLDELRKELTAKMSGYTDPSQRVARLLADTESHKVLTDLLASIITPTLSR